MNGTGTGGGARGRAARWAGRWWPVSRSGAGRSMVRAQFRLTGPEGLPGVVVDARHGGAPGTGHLGAVATRALAEAGFGHLGGHLRLRTYGRPPAADTARAVRRAVRRAVTAHRT